MIFFLLACAGANDSAMCHEAPTYDAWTKGFLKSKCQGCHAETAPDRFGAPEGIHFDTYDATVERIELIRSSILERETITSRWWSHRRREAAAAVVAGLPVLSA